MCAAGLQGPAFCMHRTYNPEEGRGKSISRTEAIDQLVETVSNIRPDNFEPTLINQTDDYVYFEFQSPTFGFIDDVVCFSSVLAEPPVLPAAHSILQLSAGSSSQSEHSSPWYLQEFFFPDDSKSQVR